MRFELLYVEKLKARQAVLLKGSSSTRPEAAEDTKEKREELVEDPEAVDNVLNCSVVKLAVEVSTVPT